MILIEWRTWRWCGEDMQWLCVYEENAYFVLHEVWLDNIPPILCAIVNQYTEFLNVDKSSQSCLQVILDAAYPVYNVQT